MESFKSKTILISGASIAGLSTAYWMHSLGYQVTVIETAAQPRTTGAAVDLRENAIDAVKRMGIFEQLKASRLNVEKIEFKNASGVTEGLIQPHKPGEQLPDDEIEIERDKFMGLVYDGLKNDVKFIFSNSITTIRQTDHAIEVGFKNGQHRSFDLLIGCDGIHSIVRKLWFGHEDEYSHFLDAYFSITIVNKLLIEQKTMQMHNVPGKAITLNAYNNKTDIIFCFYSEKEIRYDYRNTAQQRQIIAEQFTGQNWRTAELLQEVQQSENFYFDKFCQIKMPSWTKGRVALVGDAGYCASPAAGMGASLSVTGAAALADALQKHNGDFEAAFKDYNKNMRPFVEGVQIDAKMNIIENFIPLTEEAIRRRNAQNKF